MRRSALVWIVAAGCRGGSGEGEGGSDTSGAPVDLPAPRFLEPSNAELHIPATQHEDLDLDVVVVPGATQVIVDGVAIGTLDPAEPFGALSADALLVHLAGASIPSTHTLQLRTADAVETQLSELVTVFVDPEPDPTIEATLADSIVATGDGIAALGTDDSGVLIVVDGAELLVLAAAGAAWDPARTHAMTLPGYVVADDDRVPAIGVARTSDDLTVAWRVEHPGVRIDVTAARWGDPAGEPRPALVLDTDWVGPFEFAAIGRPLLFDDVLIAELRVHADTESPRAGDRGLARVQLGAGLEPGPPARVQLGLVDADAIAPAFDPVGAAHGGPDTVALRRDGREAVVLEIDATARTTALRPSLATGSIGALAQLDGPLATVLGGFGARIVVGSTTDPAVLALGLVDDRGNAGILDASVDLAAFDLSAPSGSPALGLVRGAPLALVPFGAERPVLAIAVVASEPTVQPMPELACDAVALPQTSAGNAEGAIGFACLRDRELRLGTLTLR